MMGEKKKNSGESAKKIDPNSAFHTQHVSPVSVWISASYAPEWFKDAINEALTGEDRESTRREIIFAVSFIESYLVEWLRDDIFKDIRLISKYAPIRKRIGITKKLKNILSDLYSRELIPNEPNFGEHYWQEWTDLVKYRHGLTHGVASLPDSDSVEKADRPKPSPDELANLPHGWASKTIINLVFKMHEFARTSIPDWFVENNQDLIEKQRR
jgi:hypothetical protein